MIEIQGDIVRVPILMWGDIVVGQKAITRRTLVGDRAHECMYAWVYLTDFLAFRRLSEKVTNLKQLSNLKIFKNFDELVWKELNRSEVDPHFQIKSSYFETACFLNGILRSLKTDTSKGVEITELGQTFFTFIDKFRLLDALSENPLDKNINLEWTGIDNSEFANITAKTLHQKDDNLQFIYDWKNYASKGLSLFHSRFVCSYAIPTTREFTDFLKQNFTACVIEDAFSTESKEEQIYNHGQPQTFYNLEYFSAELSKAGYKLHLLDWYGDYPGGSNKCFVGKFLIYKNETLDVESLKKFIQSHGHTFSFENSVTKDFLQYMKQNITEQDWSAIKKNKLVNPVWSRTEKINADFKTTVRNFAREVRNKFLILKNGYSRHDLRGQNMDESIMSFINEKK